MQFFNQKKEYLLDLFIPFISFNKESNFSQVIYSIYFPAHALNHFVLTLHQRLVGAIKLFIYFQALN
jgi:hypothetical protein